MKIIISSKEVLDYIILNRRKNELEFKKNFLVVKGANSNDPQIIALDTAIANLDNNLKPLKEKMALAGLKTLTLNRKELETLNKEINSYSVEEVVSAASSKTGELYEKMKKRGTIAKQNYEFKEELAALSVILTMAPVENAKEIRELVENEKNEVAVVLPEDIKNKITPLMERLGYTIKLDGENIKIERYETRFIPRWVNDEKVWVEPEKTKEFDDNEKKIKEIMNKIQYYTAKSQINEMTDDEKQMFKSLQEEYIKKINLRASLCFPAYTDVKTQVEVAENQ